MDHAHHTHRHGHDRPGRTPVSWAAAATATLHCLTGCAAPGAVNSLPP